MMTFWPAIQGSKDPGGFAILFEDTAALLGILVAFSGIFFGHLLHQPRLDGAASIVIGLILIVAAILMANEVKGLLVRRSIRQLNSEQDLRNCSSGLRRRTCSSSIDYVSGA